VPENTTVADVATIQKSIETLSTNLETTYVKKTDAEALNKSISDLGQEVKNLGARIHVGDDNRTKDSKFGFTHLGEFAQSVYKAGLRGEQEDDRLKLITKAVTGVSQGSGPDVGYLFPPGFVAGITETPYQTDDLLSRVRKIPIDASQESITLTYYDDLNRTTGIRGGMAAYWKAEADQMTGTKPKLRQIELKPNELYAFAYATEKSLRNSPVALGAILTSGMQEAIRFKIGDSIVNGDGVAKPRGILNSPDKISVAKETSQGAATINHVNVTKMWKRMPAWMRNNAIWLANQDTEDQFERMARSAIKNDGTALESADTMAAYNPEKNTLFNRPIVFCEYCATLGTVGDFILWAPQHYLVATKAGQGPEMSMHLRFDYAESAFRVIFEIDGKSEYPGVFTPNKGSVTRSSIVTLDTRS
jgi:HK97 family phage major capsid protein